MDIDNSKTDGDIPSPLSLYQRLINGPQGKGFAVVFVWASSDLDTGNALLEKVRSWAPVATSTVTPTTMAAHSEVAEALVPKQAYGSILSLHVTPMSSEVVDLIAAHAHLLPNDPDRVNLEGIYGDRYKTLQDIKQKYDPGNMFKNTLVQL